MSDKKFYTEEELNKMTVFQLREVAREIGVSSPTSKKKEEIIAQYRGIAEGEIQPTRSTRGRRPVNKPRELGQDGVKSETTPASPEENQNNKTVKKNVERENVQVTQPQEEAVEELEEKHGVLDIHADGYGFLRAENCEYGNKDTYVSAKLIKTLGLRAGDKVIGRARRNAENKPPALVAVDEVNGNKPENLRNRPNFDNLIPIYPDERLRLELKTGKSDFAIRCIDLIAPIGKGQRAMIVSPPKAGKTTLLKKIANSISINYPDVMLFVLLVDERPEEVTDMQRSINGEVIYSTFDETPEHHCKSAELLIERAKRNVELGKDVVIIMDSLTRLARAYNLTIPPTGRTLSGGIDPGALHSPKRFFGSARNIENGGSLTIIDIVVIDTGRRMDDVSYEK